MKKLAAFFVLVASTSMIFAEVFDAKKCMERCMEKLDDKKQCETICYDKKDDKKAGQSEIQGPRFDPLKTD